MKWMVVGASLLLSCGSGAVTWQRYPVLREFGSFAGIDADGNPYAATAAGTLMVDDSAQDWQRVAMPGSAAKYFVALDGREFASTYGVYVREPGASSWTLLEGSRALDLEVVTQDGRRNVYARTNDASAGGVVGRSWYVRAAADTSWKQLALDAAQTPELVTDFRANVYVRAGSSSGIQQLSRLEGEVVTPVPHPTASTFDFRGDRFLVAAAGASRADDGQGGVTTVSTAFRIERVTAAGELEEWVRFDDAQSNAAIRTFFGFGKDDRFYAAVADGIASLPEGAEYATGDIVSVGRGDTAWTLAVSPLAEGDDGQVGPTLLSSYGGGFVSDGSLIFAACESGCTGTGNSFSYGVWRLRLGGQP